MVEKIGRILRDILFPPFSELEIVALLFSLFVFILFYPLFKIGTSLFSEYPVEVSVAALGWLIFLYLFVRFKAFFIRFENYLKKHPIISSFIIYLFFYFLPFHHNMAGRVPLGIIYAIALTVLLVAIFSPFIYIVRDNRPMTFEQKKYFASYFYVILFLLVLASTASYFLKEQNRFDYLSMFGHFFVFAGSVIPIMLLFMSRQFGTKEIIAYQVSDEQMSYQDLFLIIILTITFYIVFSKSYEFATLIVLNYFYTVTIVLALKKISFWAKLRNQWFKSSQPSKKAS